MENTAPPDGEMAGIRPVGGFIDPWLSDMGGNRVIPRFPHAEHVGEENPAGHATTGRNHGPLKNAVMTLSDRTSRRVPHPKIKPTVSDGSFRPTGEG